MGLPEPTLSFTIPSGIHDDTVLDARIYHPTNTESSFDDEEVTKRGAIIAHPYAPLGGSYDDPIVGLVAGQVLKEGFVVCTFNFR
jgi:alpha/beta superfamily hydrolase